MLFSSMMLGTQDLVPDHLIKDWRHFNDRGRKAHLKTVTTRRPTVKKSMDYIDIPHLRLGCVRRVVFQEHRRGPR